jgi:hypothetical protein
MWSIDPLPFRIRVPGHDSIDTQGVVSITIKLEGLLTLIDEAISLEWTATRQIESVSLNGIRDEVDESPVGRCVIPVSAILEARMRGGWWAPRLELRARTLDAFEDIPTAKQGVARLKLRRSDRKHARVICNAIKNAKRLSDGQHAELPPSD